MCGIFGYNWEDKGLAKKISLQLKHRGPDQQGVFCKDGLTLGHRRLSILDLSAKGKQPMQSKDRNFIISFNGEIFNYVELKKDLLEKGYVFVSKTDTEVLLHGYMEYGRSFLERLDGQFAFCIYDTKKKELFLARDRLGINPLYYYVKGNEFMFGSEIKVMFAHLSKKEIDEFSLYYYFLYGYTPRRKSILKDVHKLEPGHYVRYSLDKKKIMEYEPYWKLSFATRIRDEKKASKKIVSELDKAIKERLVADVDVGAYLSGGVDSSAVVSLASKYKKNIKTFSVKFDRAGFDESAYAEVVAKKYKTEHHVVEFGAKDVRRLVKDLSFYWDEPFGDASMVPTYLVAKVARKHVSVSLSGDGGDELFGGYSFYGIYKKLQYQCLLPRLLYKMMYSFCSGFKGPVFEKAKVFFEYGMLSRKQKVARLRSYLTRDEFMKLSGKRPEEFYDVYASCFRKGHFANELSNVEIHNYLSENNQTKVDRASLANSLESRPPMLDHKFVELAASISGDLKYKGEEGKYILKKSLEKLLPKNILYRKKQGFAVPIKHYFKHELHDLVQKYVFSYDKHKYVRKGFLQSLKKEFEKDEWSRDFSRIIWSILMFNLWYERWILGNESF